MGTRDPRVAAYIGRSAEFARPILSYLRAVVHAACPGVEETLKWSAPSFLYHGMLCNFAAFKAHAVFGFSKGTLVVGRNSKSREAMGSFGRLTSLADLPPKRELTSYIKRAMELNEQGVKAPRKHKAAPRRPLRTPAELSAAL